MTRLLVALCQTVALATILFLHLAHGSSWRRVEVSGSAFALFNAQNETGFIISPNHLKTFHLRTESRVIIDAVLSGIRPLDYDWTRPCISAAGHVWFFAAPPTLESLSVLYMLNTTSGAVQSIDILGEYVLASVSSYENKVFYTNVDSAGKRWLRVVDDRTGYFSNVVELPIGSKTHEVYAFKDHVLVATVLPDALEHYLIWNGSTLTDVAQNAPNVPFIIRPLLTDSGNLVWTSPLGTTQIPAIYRCCPLVEMSTSAELKATLRFSDKSALYTTVDLSNVYNNSMLALNNLTIVGTLDDILTGQSGTWPHTLSRQAPSVLWSFPAHWNSASNPFVAQISPSRFTVPNGAWNWLRASDATEDFVVLALRSANDNSGWLSYVENNPADPKIVPVHQQSTCASWHTSVFDLGNSITTLPFAGSVSLPATTAYPEKKIVCVADTESGWAAFTWNANSPAENSATTLASFSAVGEIYGTSDFASAKQLENRPIQEELAPPIFINDTLVFASIETTLVNYGTFFSLIRKDGSFKVYADSSSRCSATLSQAAYRIDDRGIIVVRGYYMYFNVSSQEFTVFNAEPSTVALLSAESFVRQDERFVCSFHNSSKIVCFDTFDRVQYEFPLTYGAPALAASPTALDKSKAEWYHLCFDSITSISVGFCRTNLTSTGVLSAEIISSFDWSAGSVAHKINDRWYILLQTATNQGLLHVDEYSGDSAFAGIGFGAETSNSLFILRDHSYIRVHSSLGVVVFAVSFELPFGGDWIVAYDTTNPTKGVYLVGQLCNAILCNTARTAPLKGEQRFCLVGDRVIFAHRVNATYFVWMSSSLTNPQQDVQYLHSIRDDITNCYSINDGNAALVMGEQFAYFTNGTESGTTVVAPGAQIDMPFFHRIVSVSKQSALYNTVANSIAFLSFEACTQTSDCPAGALCSGGLCATPFSDSTCRGYPPSSYAICSSGQWILPGGWIVQADKRIIPLSESTTVEGDIRFTSTNSTKGIQVIVSNLNITVSASGCADFSEATLHITNTSSPIPSVPGEYQVDLFKFRGFCNGQENRFHDIQIGEISSGLCSQVTASPKYTPTSVSLIFSFVDICSGQSISPNSTMTPIQHMEAQANTNAIIAGVIVAALVVLAGVLVTLFLLRHRIIPSLKSAKESERLTKVLSEAAKAEEMRSMAPPPATQPQNKRWTVANPTKGD